MVEPAHVPLPATRRAPVPGGRKIVAGFGAALLVLLLAGGAAWWHLRQFEATGLRLDQTHRILHRLGQALTSLLSLQNSTRGFVLTGRDDLLEAFPQREAALDRSLRDLRELTAASPLLQPRLVALGTLSDRARTLMAERISARRLRGAAAAADSAALLAGEEAAEKFRRLIDDLAAEETRLLLDRSAASQDAARATLLATLAACFVASAFVVFSGLVVYHDFKLRRRAEDSLALLNRQLEERVRDRTAQLETANLAMTREIAERQRAQDDLRASERRLLTTLDGMLEGCQIIGPDWRYLYLNETATVHARRHKQELLGHTLIECSPGIERTPLFAALRRCLEERTTARLEQLVRYPDGTHAWFLLGIQPVPEGVALLSLDITERKLGEDRVRQDNASLEQRVRERTVQLETVNRELEAFSYSVSHDLRAPLRHIDGFSHLLGQHAAAQLDDKARRYLATISSSARHMGCLIDNLLAFSRVGRIALHIEALNHNALVADTLAAGRFDQSGHPILWEIAPLPPVCADPSLHRQVWANLLGNAVKYSGKNPRPRIAIAHRPDVATPDENVFSITDNGVGFDPAYTDRLFGVFQRLHGPTEFEGTGIGLANVRRIITRHGGRTWAEGRVGEGATFYFSLPASAATPSPLPA